MKFTDQDSVNTVIFRNMTLMVCRGLVHFLLVLFWLLSQRGQENMVVLLFRLSLKYEDRDKNFAYVDKSLYLILHSFPRPLCRGSPPRCLVPRRRLGRAPRWRQSRQYLTKWFQRRRPRMKKPARRRRQVDIVHPHCSRSMCMCVCMYVCFETCKYILHPQKWKSFWSLSWLEAALACGNGWCSNHWPAFT